MDYLDMLVNSSDEYLTGYFYKRRPKSPTDARVTFKYKQADANSRSFGRVLGNVRSDTSRYAISTNDDCGFIIGGYIQTQNGLFWEITDIVGNEEEKSTINVLRFFKTVKNAECLVRMIQVDDLFNVEEAYDKLCEVEIALEEGSTEGLTAVVTTGTVCKETFTAIAEEGFIKFEMEKGLPAKVELKLGETILQTLSIKAHQTQKNALKLSVLAKV